MSSGATPSGVSATNLYVQNSYGQQASAAGCEDEPTGFPRPYRRWERRRRYWSNIGTVNAITPRCGE